MGSIPKKIAPPYVGLTILLWGGIKVTESQSPQVGTGRPWPTSVVEPKKKKKKKKKFHRYGISKTNNVLNFFRSWWRYCEHIFFQLLPNYAIDLKFGSRCWYASGWYGSMGCQLVWALFSDTTCKPFRIKRSYFNHYLSLKAF